MNFQHRAPAFDPPVRGQWAILNPPGHARLAFDFLAVDDQKSPYKDVSLLRHIFSTIPVSATLAWEKPVFAVMDGTVVAASDGAPDRERICMAKDLLRLMLFGPKLVPPFSALGGNYVILKCGDAFPLYAHLKNGSISVRPGDSVRRGSVPADIAANVAAHCNFIAEASACGVDIVVFPELSLCGYELPLLATLRHPQTTLA